MSIALLIELDNGASELVPVATEVVFSECWQPLCVELGLVWIPLFQTGFPVQSADAPDVLEELAQVVAAVRSRPSHAHVLRRAEGLIAALKAVDFDAVDSVFIG